MLSSVQLFTFNYFEMSAFLLAFQQPKLNCFLFEKIHPRAIVLCYTEAVIVYYPHYKAQVSGVWWNFEKNFQIARWRRRNFLRCIAYVLNYVFAASHIPIRKKAYSVF